MKTHTTLSIDGELLNQAKQNNINMSELLEWAIKNKEKLKKDLPEEELYGKCCVCSEMIQKGFICETTNKIYCDKCNMPEYDKRLSDGKKHRIFKDCIDRTPLIKEHVHTRFGGFEKPMFKGKTLKDIEKGNDPNKTPIKAVEPLISAPF